MRGARHTLATTCAALQLLAVARPAFGDPAPADTIYEKDPSNPTLFSFNYGPTQSPALNLLGVASSKATLSTSTQPFVLSIPSLFTGSGDQTIAIDVSPAWALQDKFPLTYKTYDTNSFLARAWYRTRIEFAATDGAASTTASKIQPSGIAFGLATSPLRSSDPITAALPGHDTPFFQECLNTNVSGTTPLITRVTNATTAIHNAYDQDSTVLDLLESTIKKDRTLYLTPAPELPVPQADAATIVQAYLELHSSLKDGPTLVPSQALPPRLPVPQQEAYAELKDLLLRFVAARQSTTDVGQARLAQTAQDVAAQIQNDLSDGDLPAPKAGLSASDEQDDVATYLQAKTDITLADRLFRKDAALPQAGVPAAPSTVAAATVPGQVTQEAIAILIWGWAADPQHRDKDPSHKDLASLANNLISKSGDDQAAAILDAAGITKDMTTCVQASALVANASNDLTVGLGYVESGSAGSLRDLHPGGETVWAAFRTPILMGTRFNNLGSLAATDMVGPGAKAAYTLAGASFEYQRHVTLVTGDAKDPLVSGDVYGGWIGVQQNLPNLQFGGEVGYTDTVAFPGVASKYSSHGFRWLASANYLLPIALLPSTWLGISYGTANGSSSKLDDKKVLVTLSFSTPPASTMFGSAASSGGGGK